MGAAAAAVVAVSVVAVMPGLLAAEGAAASVVAVVAVVAAGAVAAGLMPSGSVTSRPPAAHLGEGAACAESHDLTPASVAFGSNPVNAPIGGNRIPCGRAPMADVRILCGSTTDMFVVVDGVRIARRGYAGTPQAGTWVSLEPGWEVVDDGRRNNIAVKHNGVSVH